MWVIPDEAEPDEQDYPGPQSSQQSKMTASNVRHLGGIDSGSPSVDGNKSSSPSASTVTTTSVSMYPSTDFPTTGSRSPDWSHLPPSPSPSQKTHNTSLLSPRSAQFSINSTHSSNVPGRSSTSGNSNRTRSPTPSGGLAVPRQAVSPTIHSRGSILVQASGIEDDEQRRLSEMAFLDF